jgi:membrane-associated protease RseP (regulator of RpoE activity)
MRALFNTLAVSFSVLLTAGDASSFVPPPLTGAQITGVRAFSPAVKAGLEVGDTIVAIDSQPVKRVDDLAQLTTGKRRVVLTVLDGRTGAYVYTIAYPVNGRVGVRFRMTRIVDNVLPAIDGLARLMR